MIEIGSRVRIVGSGTDRGGTDRGGRLGTVILVTAAGDGYLVEMDESVAIGPGSFRGRELVPSQRRWWCGAEDLRVVTPPGWLWRRLSRVRRLDPPADLAAARSASRGLARPKTSEESEELERQLRGA